jgi:hypothetical protein
MLKNKQKNGFFVKYKILNSQKIVVLNLKLHFFSTKRFETLIFKK